MLNVLAFLFYSGLSLIFLQHLLPVWSVAIPGGLEDTRLFLWNAWWFRYAIDTLHTSPFFTHMLFHPFGGSLVSHDFPLWTNLVTYLAQAGGLNFVAASNVWFILTWVLTGFCSYLLVWQVTQQRAPAIVAGVYVMTHSYTLARAMQNWGQFNLFGIALFLWLLMRARHYSGWRNYALAGVALAWTAACHYYFLIYSFVIWIAIVFVDLFPWRLRLYRPKPLPEIAGWRKIVAGIAVLAAGVAGWIVLLNPGQMLLGSARISLQTPANAMLVMWGCLGALAVSYFKLTATVAQIMPEKRFHLIRNNIVLAVVAFVCLTPLWWSAIQLALAGGYPKQTILWKTHLPGANLLALFMPNPLHVLWGESISEWFDVHGMNAQEQAASIGWVCLGVILWSRVWKPRTSMAQFLSPGTTEPHRRHWLFLAILSTIMAMGTYLHILWLNLWLPLPFYFWRLLPVLGNVRVPERWMAVGAIAWAAALGLALVELARRKNWPLGKVCLIAGALILIENWPGLPLGSPPAERPMYETLRLQPAGAVLPLPFYAGDSSIGAGNAPPGLIWDYLGVQIYHQHPVLGGYVGRIQRKLINAYKSDPFFGRVIDLEEEKPVSAEPLPRSAACQAMKDFQVTYVLVYTDALNTTTWDFVEKSLPLRLLSKEKTLELYTLACPK